MCSTRKAPMGTMPVREWSLRQKKECPSPARRGCTPRMGGAAGGAGAGGAIEAPWDLVSARTEGLNLCGKAIIPLRCWQRQENQRLFVRLSVDLCDFCLTPQASGFG